MNFRAILLLPSSRGYLKLIKAALENSECKKLIESPLQSNFSEKDLDSVVKSYFLAARTINKCNCLPRSIALYHHLKSLGFTVEHKFGVNKKETKFYAHAWVEHQGEPLNEHQNLYSRFTVLEPTKEVIKTLKLI